MVVSTTPQVTQRMQAHKRSAQAVAPEPALRLPAHKPLGAASTPHKGCAGAGQKAGTPLLPPAQDGGPRLPTRAGAGAPRHKQGCDPMLSAAAARPAACPTDALREADDAAREACLENWSLSLGAGADAPVVPIRTLLHHWAQALAAALGHTSVRVWRGGSAVAYQLNTAWRSHLPQDVDPFMVLGEGCHNSVESLQIAAIAALTETLATLGWPAPRVTSRILKEDTQDAIVLVRLGQHHAHIDVRIGLQDAVSRAFDFRCNALVSDLEDSRRWGALPGLDLKSVVEELNLGVYTQVHALGRDSLQRATKMRCRGFVPGAPALDAALVPTLVHFLRTHRDVAHKGFGLLFSEWVYAIVTGLPCSSQGAHVKNQPGPADATALGFYANSIVHIAQVQALPETPLMIAHLRRSLGRALDGRAISAQTRALVAALQTTTGLRGLHAVCAGLADTHAALLDASQPMLRLHVSRVETPGTQSLRLCVPDFGGYLILPQPFCDAACDRQPLAALGGAAHLPAIEMACTALEAPCLASFVSALMQASSRGPHLAQLGLAAHLRDAAATWPHYPSMWPVRLVWAAHYLDPALDLHGSVQAALHTAPAEALAPALRCETEVLAAAHKANRTSHAYALLLDANTDPVARARAWQSLTQLFVTEAGQPVHKAAERCLTWLAGAPLAALNAAADALPLAALTARIAAAVPDHLQARAAMLGLLGASYHDAGWRKLTDSLAHHAARLATDTADVQRTLWRLGAASWPPRAAWRIAQCIPQLYAHATQAQITAWLSELDAEALTQHPALLARALGAVHHATAAYRMAARLDIARALVTSQAGYILLGRILTATPTKASRVHLERIFLQADGPFVQNAAMHVAGMTEPTHPLFLCLVTRAFKGMASQSAGDAIMRLSRLWKQLQQVLPCYRLRMQRIVCHTLAHLDSVTLDRLPGGAWPKQATIRQWAALADGCQTQEAACIFVACAFIARARGDLWLMLKLMQRASVVRADVPQIMPALMALNYRVVSMLPGLPEAALSRAATALWQMSEHPLRPGSVWQRYALIIERDVAQGLLTFGETDKSLTMLQTQLAGPYSAWASASLFDGSLSRVAQAAGHFDKALGAALLDAAPTHTPLLHTWAGHAAAGLCQEALSAAEQGDKDTAEQKLERAIMLQLARQPQDSLWRTDPVFPPLVQVFGCPMLEASVQAVVDAIRTLKPNVATTDMCMLVRARALIDVAWVEAAPDVTVARARALQCLKGFGIDVTRPLADTLLGNIDEIEPLSLIVTQIAGSLCHPDGIGPAAAQERLAWLVDGVSHAPQAARPLYNLSVALEAADPMAATKIALHLVYGLNTAIDASDWPRAEALGCMVLGVTCATVFGTHPKHAINLAKTTLTKIQNLPHAHWQSWVNAGRAAQQIAYAHAKSYVHAPVSTEAHALAQATKGLDDAVARLAHRSTIAPTLDLEDESLVNAEQQLRRWQFEVLMAEVVDGPNHVRLRLLATQLSHLRSGLDKEPVMHAIAVDRVSAALSDPILQAHLLAAFARHLPDGTACHAEPRTLMMLVDAMRTHRPLEETDYACLLDIAATARRQVGLSAAWDACLAYLLNMAAIDVFEEEPIALCVLRKRLEARPALYRRKNPWIVRFTRDLAGLIDGIEQTRMQARCIIEDAEAMAAKDASDADKA